VQEENSERDNLTYKQTSLEEHTSTVAVTCDNQTLSAHIGNTAAQSDNSWIMALLIQLRHYQLPNDTAVSISCGLLRELLESGANPIDYHVMLRCGSKTLILRHISANRIQSDTIQSMCYPW